MPFDLDPLTKSTLSQIGVFEFYKRASQIFETSLITSTGETIVSIGQYRQYEINDGLKTLDPLQTEYYDPKLCNSLKGEHIIVSNIPFDPDQSFIITVPEFALLLNDEGNWSVTCPTGMDLKTINSINRICTTKVSGQNVNLTSYAISNEEEPSSFKRRISDALRTIETTQLEKVVLSKIVEVEMEQLVPGQFIIDQLALHRPATFITAIGNCFGASPELVIELKQKQLKSHPLAGTATNKKSSQLLNSTKDNQEHDAVVRQLLRNLHELDMQAKQEESPSIANYGEIVHLGTEITADLPDDGQLSSIEIAAHCAPTAAINGEPFGLALEFIRAHEPVPRANFGGLVGYQKSGGDGSWILNIRSINLDGRFITFRAGVGIVQGSNPNDENIEADTKISALMSSLLGTTYSSSST